MPSKKTATVPIKNETVVVNLRAVPKGLHLRLLIGSRQRNLTIEQFIIETLESNVAELG